MYTTIIHPLRKMYCLSINEYCVLDAIKNLSNNIKYDGWCVLSVPNLAKALDLSEPTVRRAYSKLQEVELLNKRLQTPQDTAVRASDEWNEWFMPEKAHILLGMKTNTNEIMGYIPKPDSDDTTPISLIGGSSQFDRRTGINLIGNTNKDINKDIKPSTKAIEIYNKLKFTNIAFLNEIDSLLVKFPNKDLELVATKVVGLTANSTQETRWMKFVNMCGSEFESKQKPKNNLKFL